MVRLPEYAVEQDVRAVMIAGTDMFDGERVKKRTVDEVLWMQFAGQHRSIIFTLQEIMMK